MEEQNRETPVGIVRETFQGNEYAGQVETASTAMAVGARATIEARAILAMRRPRSWDDCRAKLLRECERPAFARAARYRKPLGKQRNDETGQYEQTYAEGLSIRFAEAALRNMHNISAEISTIYDDESKTVVRVGVADIETNAAMSSDITVTKTVERRRLKDGQRPIKQRRNSFGDTVFIVEATDEEVLNKRNALVSKALRDLVLRFLPGDIQDECEAKCVIVANLEDAKDPDKARKDLLDAFVKIGVMPSAVAEYLGHDPGHLLPAELAEMRAIYSAIRDGETTWASVMAAKAGDEVAPGAAASKAAAEAALKKAKDKIAEKASKKEAPAAPVTPKQEAPEEPKGREPGMEG